MSDIEQSFHEQEEDHFENGENGDMEADQSKSTDEAVLAEMKARVRDMEEEAEKLKQLQSEVEKQMSMESPPSSKPSAESLLSPVSSDSSSPRDLRLTRRDLSVEYDPSLIDCPTIQYDPEDSLLNLSVEEKKEADMRSIYVGNVDYGATAEELEAHFHGCGSVNRVTILCNKFYGNPKGFAYIEFANKESVDTAMAMDDSLFRGRQIKVNPKRTNRPGISTTNRGGPRGRARGRVSRGAMYGGYRPVRRARSYRRGLYYPY